MAIRVDRRNCHTQVLSLHPSPQANPQTRALACRTWIPILPAGSAGAVSAPSAKSGVGLDPGHAGKVLEHIGAERPVELAPNSRRIAPANRSAKHLQPGDADREGCARTSLRRPRQPKTRLRKIDQARPAPLARAEPYFGDERDSRALANLAPMVRRVILERFGRFATHPCSLACLFRGLAHRRRIDGDLNLQIRVAFPGFVGECPKRFDRSGDLGEAAESPAKRMPDRSLPFAPPNVPQLYKLRLNPNG